MKRHVAQPGPMGNPERTVCRECGHAPWCRVHEGQVMVCGTGGPNGTPCKPDIFEATYEVVEQPKEPAVRNGAIYSCECWYHAMPGDHVGMSNECPIHGRVVMNKANVDEPGGVRHERNWVEREAVEG